MRAIDAHAIQPHKRRVRRFHVDTAFSVVNARHSRAAMRHTSRAEVCGVACGSMPLARARTRLARP
jgi:hypothetical protein